MRKVKQHVPAHALLLLCRPHILLPSKRVAGSVITKFHLQHVAKHLLPTFAALWFPFVPVRFTNETPPELLLRRRESRVFMCRVRVF